MNLAILSAIKRLRIAELIIFTGVLAVSLPCGALMKRTCRTVAVYVTGCTYANGELLGCQTYFDHYTTYCEWVPVGGGGGGGGGGGTPKDTDANHHIDNWHSIVVTTDPCAYQLDEGDKLGSDFGGGNSDRPHHNGVDIQCNKGDPVYSIGSGVIVGVGGNRQDGPGLYIIVNHDDGTQAQYFHLDNQLVQVGQHVWAGQLIAQADSTGYSSGNHLHIMLKDQPGGTPIEPLSYPDISPTQTELNGGC